MDFISGGELLEQCGKTGKTISQIMRQREVSVTGASETTIIERMSHSYDIMKAAVKRARTEEIISMGGLIGGECRAMDERRGKTAPVCGVIASKAAGYAMGVLEVNASMGLIVAAPTAGSSGVIPGVFLAVQEEFSFSDEEMTQALFNAGAVGYIISRNATVAGAEGGCQAEVGSASAMAASAAVELMGGTPEQCLNAAGAAISNILGLVCDPIAGLVEAPCQKRNAMGAANALVSAEIALAGIGGVVPFDEVVTAMYRVGRALPAELRETALGGIAATPTACGLCTKIFK